MPVKDPCDKSTEVLSYCLLMSWVIVKENKKVRESVTSQYRKVIKEEKHTETPNVQTAFHATPLSKGLNLYNEGVELVPPQARRRDECRTATESV